MNVQQTLRILKPRGQSLGFFDLRPGFSPMVFRRFQADRDSIKNILQKNEKNIYFIPYTAPFKAPGPRQNGRKPLNAVWPWAREASYCPRLCRRGRRPFIQRADLRIAAGRFFRNKGEFVVTVFYTAEDASAISAAYCRFPERGEFPEQYSFFGNTGARGLYV